MVSSGQYYEISVSFLDPASRKESLNDHIYEPQILKKDFLYKNYLNV